MKVPATRSYTMRARAEGAAATRANIVTTARGLLFKHSFHDITIDRVAREAGTTTRTILRLFPGKEELFAEALDSLGELGQAPITPGDIDALVSGMYDFYDQVGDMVIRWLADEPRLPAMRQHLQRGRKHLRSWVAAAFATDLERRQGAERQRLHDALVVLFDVHPWKLLRRDLRRSRAEADATIAQLVRGLLTHIPHVENRMVELVRRRKPAS